MMRPSSHAGEGGEQPPLLFPDYRSSVTRAPAEMPVKLPHSITERTAPAAWEQLMGAAMADLTAQHEAAPLGQRIIVTGRVLDEQSRPVRNSLVEVWQANAAGRYIHSKDDWNAPIDPNFTGTGRAFTDDSGRYRFVTIRPGAYPWGNHYNAWRPSHIHFSLSGPSYAARLVTQMYFPDDPLIEIDPIANAVPMPYRRRLIGRLDIGTTEPNHALGYVFDIVLRGRDETPMDEDHDF
jgi:protocatechuate 3,4-dioxygenase beta subunit